MPIPVEVRSAIDELRSRNPATAGKSDERLYRYLKKSNPSLVWSEVDSAVESKGQQRQVDTSPSFLNSFQTWFDYGIDENSADWMKSAYTNSLTGLTEKLVTGKERYDLKQGEPGGYNPNIFEDIFSMALSFLMPLDFMAMAAGGGAGGLALKGFGVTAAKEASRIGVKQSLKHALAEQAIKQAGGLAVYEGALGGVQAGIDGEDVMGAIGKGVVHGGILGGLAGLAGGGLAYRNASLLNKFTKEGKIATEAGKEASKMLSIGEKASLKATGILGQVPAEAGVFTAAEMAERIAHGEDLRLRDLGTAFFRNLGLFTVTKAQHKLFSKSYEHYKLLEEAERQKFGVDSEGRPNEAAISDKAATEHFKEAREKREQGDELGAIAAERAGEELNKHKRGVDEKYIKFKEDLDQSRNDTKTLIKDHESGIQKESIPRANKLIKSVEEQIGLAEKLIEHATDPVNPMFEGLLESFRQHKEELLVQREKWSGEAARNQASKEKPVWLEKKILEEGERLGIDISDINLKNREGRAEATSILKEERLDIAKEKGIGTGRALGAEQYKDVATTSAEIKQISESIREKAKEKDFKIREATELERTILDFDRPSKQPTHIPEIKHDVTKNALLTWVGEGEGSRGSARLIAKGLKYLKKDSIEQVKAKDVKKILQGIDKRDSSLPSRPEGMATAFAEFVDWAGYKKLIEPPFRKVDLSNKGVWQLAKQIRERIAGERIEAIGEVDLQRDISKSVKKLPKFKESTTEQKELHVSADLHSVEGLGIRTGEFNALTPANIKTKSVKGKNIYYFHVTPGLVKKGGGNPRPVEISKQTYDRIQKIIKENRVGKNEPIFKSKNTAELIKGLYEANIKVEDVRKFIETKADQVGMTQRQKDLLSFYLGHRGSSEVVTKYYKGTMKESTKVELSGILKDIISEKISPVEGSSKLSKLFGTKEIKYQLESAASDLGTTVKELKKQIDHFKKLYPELDIQLKKNLGKLQGENVLGRITGHLVEIAKGRAKADTIPHEVSHHVVDVLRAFGDKGSKDLIRDGERMFRGEENMVQSIGEYVAGNLKNKTTIGKVKNFLQKFWSHLKHKFGVHNEADVTRILGEKVIKGKLPDGRLKEFTTKFQKSKESPEAKKEITKINRSIHKGGEESLDRRVRDADPKGYEKARIDIFGTKDFKESNATVQDMRRYEEYLTSHPANFGNSRSALPIAKSIEQINEKYHINPDIAKANLKLMGVKDGLYENASPGTVKAYESFVRQNYDAPALLDRAYTDMLSLKGSEIGKTKHPWMYRYGRGVMPAWLVLRKFGGKYGERISDRMLDHEWAEHVLFKGPGDQAMHLIQKTLGKEKSKHMFLFDKERAERNYREGNLTPSQVDFYHKIYGEKGHIDKKTDEYRAHQAFKDTMEFYWKSYEKELLKHQTPEGAKRTIKELREKHVDGYMMRRWTSDAIKHIHKDHDIITKLVDKQVDKLAREKAQKEAKTDTEVKILEERYKKDMETRDMARHEIYNVLRYGYGHAKFPHLIPRKGLMKEYVEITDAKTGQLKKIKVYENSVEATAETYISRMSKHLANVRLFPEWTGVGSKYKIRKGTRQELVALEEGAAISNYAQLAIERQLGFDKNLRESMAEPIYKGGKMAAAVSAVIGLSSPLAGLKNLAIGIPRAIGVMGTWRTMKGIKHAFTAQAWNEARAKGYLEYGAKTLELGSVGVDVLGKNFNMRQLFSFNQMTRTENINRIISSHAGQLYFTEVSAKMRGEKGTFLMKTNKKRMRRLMEEVWHLSKEEINFIEKTKDLTTKEAMAKHSEILNKVGHFSHTTTQGGTSTVLLPLWMSSSEAKPLTLFQRMAMSTTVDIYRNFVKPIAEFGNFAPMARAAVAHSVTGSALYYVYKELFGKEPPLGSKLTQEDSFDKIMLNLFRSEFFGLAGEIIPGLNPYERELGVPIAQPVIIRNLTEALNEYTKWNAGGKSGMQAIQDWTKKSVVGLSQVKQIWRTQMAESAAGKEPYYKDFMAMRSMVRQFKKERELPMYSGEGTISRRQPYYYDLKEAMMFGSEEDVAKAYWTAVDFIVSDIEKFDPYTTPNSRYKKAKTSLKNVMSHYSPLNIQDKRKGTSKALLNQFYEWLSPENEKKAKKLKKQYEYKHRNFLRIVRNRKWRSKYYVYPYT